MGNPAPKPDNLDEQRPAAKAAYEDLFLRSIDSILLVEMGTGNVIQANDSSIKVFRISLDELEGSNIYKYCPEHFLQEFRKMIRIASRRFQPKTFEIPLVVGAGKTKIVTEMSASPLKLNDGSEVLQLLFRDITEKKENERKIAEYIAQIEQANLLLEEMATTDGMTGLTNFRQFSKILETENERASRYDSKYTIIFCDIDHFKKYNDTNGHQAGDELLKEFAKILQASVRNTDTAARYGGEEFVALLPETDIEQAVAVAERIRKSTMNANLPHAEKQPMGILSVSIGVASFPKHGKTGDEVLKAADSALYSSKDRGRNKVTLCK